MEQDDYLGSYDEFQYESYLGLENNPILQDMIKVTIEKNLPDLNGKTAYDVGFGTGFCMKLLLKNGIKSYTGMDLSPNMMSYINNVVKENGWLDKVSFVFNDAREKNLKHPNGPFDIVTNSCAIYPYSYTELLNICTHMYNNTKKGTGQVFLVPYFLDFIHTRERISDLAKFNTYLVPRLKNHERYDEFSRSVDVICTEPHYANFAHFQGEPVISKNNFEKALKEAGFTKIEALPMLTTLGSEYLLDFHKAYNMWVYRCLV